MIELIHSLGKPSFWITNAPTEAHLMPRPISSFEFQFSTLAKSYIWTPSDERGVTHYTEHGHILQTKPMYRLRFDLQFDYVKIGKVSGGVPQILSTVNHNEFEFLVYLLKHKHSFSYAGRSELRMCLNHVSSDVSTDDTHYRVVVLDGAPSTSTPAQIHGFSISFETIDFVEFPYNMAYNR